MNKVPAGSTLEDAGATAGAVASEAPVSVRVRAAAAVSSVMGFGELNLPLRALLLQFS